MTAVRLGTRGSALALAQAHGVAARLEGSGNTVEIIVIESEGDRSTEPLADLGGTGVFTTALRTALLDGRVDVVVHSYKDLPTAPAPGIELAAVPKRADPRDALIARDGFTLDTLPERARVGTGSPRRRAQLLARRPDLDVVDLRGNIDTRLGRVASDDLERSLDAVVLAAAGLDRIGRLDEATELLSLSDWPTAPAQGALAVETRTGEAKIAAKLDHRTSRLTTAAERGVLSRLEAGCAAPLGAHAELDDGLLFLSARVYRADGSEQLTASHALYPDDTPDAAGALSERVATELLSAGAAELAPLGGLR